MTYILYLGSRSRYPLAQGGVRIWGIFEATYVDMKHVDLSFGVAAFEVLIKSCDPYPYLEIRCTYPHALCTDALAMSWDACGLSFRLVASSSS